MPQRGSVTPSGGSASKGVTTASGEVTVPQRGSVTPSGGSASKGVTTASGEVTVPQRGSVTPSGGSASKGVTTASGEVTVPKPNPVPKPPSPLTARLSAAKGSIGTGIKGAFSAPSIAAAVPELVLAIADKVAARDAILRIQVKFAKEGFAKGYAAGVAGWSKEEVDSSLKNRVTHFRVKGLEDPAGLLKVSDILQIAEAYENYAVDLGYHRSSSKSQRWKENTLEWGFNALEKRNYYFNRNDDRVRFADPFIDKFAWVLSPTTDQIVQQAVDEGGARLEISTFNPL